MLTHAYGTHTHTRTHGYSIHINAGDVQFSILMLHKAHITIVRDNSFVRVIIKLSHFHLNLIKIRRTLDYTNFALSTTN